MTESEVELYFFAGNKMSRRKKRVNPDLAEKRLAHGVMYKDATRTLLMH